MQETPHHGDRWFKEAADQADARQTIQDVTARLAEITQRAGMALGETGRYPLGALTPDDEGELRMAVTAQRGTVILTFGKPTAWIGMTPHDARALANALGEWAAKA